MVGREAIVTIANDRMLHVARCPVAVAAEATSASWHGGSFWTQGGGAGDAAGGGNAGTLPPSSTSVEAMLDGVQSAADELHAAPRVA